MNIVPPEVAYFRPAVPFVILAIATYGQENQAPSSGGTQFGFIAETQISFMVPVIQYRRSGGRFKLVSIALASPFVYASNSTAVIDGRGIFGFPNQIGWFAPSMQAWNSEPNSWNRVATLDLSLLTELWQGESLEPGTLMEIYQSPMANPVQWPPLRKNPYNPFNMLSNAFGSACTAAVDLAETLAWAFKTGEVSHSIELLWSLVRSALLGARQYPPKLGAPVNFITLKQFRDADFQADCC